MTKVAPRGVSLVHVFLQFSFIRPCPSSSASIAVKSPLSVCSRHQNLTSLAAQKISQLTYYTAMKASSRQDEQDKKDRVRECHGKESSEFGAKKSCFSDDIMPHILNLYGSRATARDFEIYAPNSSFEDPLMCAHGVKQIKSAFYSIPKVFSESSIVEYSVEENMLAAGKQEILIDNKQHYKIMGKNIDMVSLIKLYVEDGKVVRHEDWWDKKPIPNRETSTFSLVGHFKEMMRRGSMLATHAMMGFGKDPTS